MVSDVTSLAARRVLRGTVALCLIAVGLVGIAPPASAASSSIRVLPGDRSARVSWNDSVTSVRAVASPGGASCTSSVPGSGCRIPGLVNGRRYTVRVTATTGAGTERVSALVVPEKTASQPSNVVAVPSNGAARVSWTPPWDAAAAEVTAYRVMAMSGNETQYCVYPVSVPEQDSCYVTGLTNGASYSFVVVAVNAAGWGPASVPSNTVTPAGPPSAPVGVTATVSGTTVTVGWSAPWNTGGSPIVSYLVTSSPTGATCSTDASRTSCQLVALEAGRSQSIFVQAINAFGASTATTVQTPVMGAVSVVTDEDGSCALLSSGKVLCWGIGYGATPVVVSGIMNATAISAGQAHFCALLSTGRVMCWGANGAGQLGDGTTTYRANPVEVSGITAAVSIGLGLSHSCAVVGADLQCWGLNSSGQLGTGNTTNATRPVTVVSRNVLAVSGGDDFTCYVDMYLGVRCVGANGSGQLGNGTTTASRSWGSVKGVSGAVALSSGAQHACVVLASGAAQCWGANSYGQLGDGSTAIRSTPVRVSGLSGAVDISAGSAQTCAELSSGSAMCWGRGNSGQLGNATSTDSSVPVLWGVASGSAPPPLGTTIGARQIATEGFLNLYGHTCVVYVNGSVACTGLGELGALGHGSETSSFVPVTVRLPIAVR